MISDQPAVVQDVRAIADGLVRLLVWARRKAPAQTNNSGVTTLATLHSVGPLRISELTEREGLTQPGMTTLINRLVEEGLAERFADPTDRRATLVRITPAGQRVLSERMAARAVEMLPDVAALSAEHQAALAGSLGALRELTKMRELTGLSGAESSTETSTVSSAE
jgi:DNA-binding MarR family transcriptional regulator